MDGKLNGEQVYYHENGKLKVRGNYTNGVRSGLDLNAVPGLKIGTRQG